jgi:LmbE family N-acetylglucosaminyl deacetylase
VSGGLVLVGAHVGDMEFTAGHLARLYAKAGEQVLIVHLTAGEGGHPSRDRAGYKAQKLEEAAAAASLLGAKHQVLPYPDGGLFATTEVAGALAQVIDEAQPEVVVTHWRGSLHPDHVNCHFAVELALSLIGSEKPRVFYADNWEDADGFRADVVVDTTEVHADWLAAARCHELFRGGVVTFDYQGYYEALATLRGRMAGVARAAAFMRPPQVFWSPVRSL